MHKYLDRLLYSQKKSQDQFLIPVTIFLFLTFCLVFRFGSYQLSVIEPDDA